MILNSPYVAHPNPPADVKSLRKNKNLVCVNMRNTRQTIRATAKGAKQYPSTQTDWKNDLENKIGN